MLGNPMVDLMVVAVEHSYVEGCRLLVGPTLATVGCVGVVREILQLVGHA